MSSPPAQHELLHIEKSVYGGDGLARTGSGQVIFLPFVLPGEQVLLPSAEKTDSGEETPRQQAPLRILEPSPDRVPPACVHFGVCGGCQYQMAAYPAQLALKTAILQETLIRAGVTDAAAADEAGLSPIQIVPSPEAYGYRNRIRLRARHMDGGLRFGYSLRGTNEFLPVTMCPIAGPLLWRAAEALLATAESSRDLARWLALAAEIELFCDGAQQKLQITLMLPGKGLDQGSFTRAIDAVQGLLPALTGAGALRLDARSGRALEPLATWGAAGLPYPVGDETYWISRGGFFQVNRFLLSTLVDKVCTGHAGRVVWDLYAGVGLFSRVLARSFSVVTAVEAHPAAAGDLQRALGRLGAQHRAVQATTLDFLRDAVLQRDRPDLVVLDPPRAGAGAEVCTLLLQLQPAEIVYLSCDPTTLARDLANLTRSGYRIAALHLIDLFPQTYHLETLVLLRRG